MITIERFSIVTQYKGHYKDILFILNVYTFHGDYHVTFLQDVDKDKKKISKEIYEFFNDNLYSFVTLPKLRDEKLAAIIKKLKKGL